MEEKAQINFMVSVIIPVFNAEKFVKKAVLSALELKEVGEVLLIEDASPDNALKICEELENEFEKVRLLRHSNGKNWGAGASRNLGIRKAYYPFIAFLDADDWYLPERFLKDKEIFEKFINADAVYSSVILENNQNDHSKIYGLNFDIRKSIGYNASPVDFYKRLIKIRHVILHTNSITLKKEFLCADKLFDERLVLHQDSELWDRLIRRGIFFAGEIKKPVAVIRRHKNNRITSRSAASTLKMKAVFIENVGVYNLYKFEEVNLLKTILRLRSKNISNKWLRRFNYYYSYYIWIFRKRLFLQKFKKETLINMGTQKGSYQKTN